MFGFSACDRIESPTAYDSVLRIVGVAERAEDTAEVCFQPKCLRCDTFLAALVNGISFNAAGNLNLDAHINTREGIIAAANMPGCSVSGQYTATLKMAPTSKSRS